MHACFIDRCWIRFFLQLVSAAKFTQSMYGIYGINMSPAHLFHSLVPHSCPDAPYPLPQRKITLLTRPHPQPASNPTVVAATAGVTGGAVASVGSTPGPTLIAANPLTRYTYNCMLYM